MAIRFKARLDKRAAEFVVKKLTDLEKPVTQADARTISKQALSEMKSMISRGLSPIKGPGIQTRFPRYKNPDKYPGKKKPKSPVNLELSGAQMRDLKSTVVKAAAGYAVEIYYTDGTDKNGVSSKIKEQGHREGANGQPKRPTIPMKKLGESFASSIQNVYLKVLGSAISRISRRKQ